MCKNINLFKKLASLVLVSLMTFSSISSKSFGEKSTQNFNEIKNRKNLSLSQKVGIGGLGILGLSGICYAIGNFF